MDTARSVSRITAFEYLALNYRPPSKKTSIRIGISATLAAFLAANGLAQSATVPLFQVDPDPTGNFTDISGGSGAPGLAPLAVTNKTAPTSFSSQEVGGASAVCCAVLGGYGALASASGWGTASAGLLKGMVSASASVTPLGRTGSTSPYAASAGAALEIAFGDSLTLTSTALRPGSPVTFDYTVGLHEILTTAGGGGANLTIIGSAGTQSTMFTDPIPFSGLQQGPLMWTETIPITGVVGQVVSIGGSLNIVAGASASPGHFASGSGIIDASDTGFFYADPVTSGLELVSASGHDYETPGVGTPSVPEPSTWAMMLLGFAGLGYVSYRKARETRAA